MKKEVVFIIFLFSVCLLPTMSIAKESSASNVKIQKTKVKTDSYKASTVVSGDNAESVDQNDRLNRMMLENRELTIKLSIIQQELLLKLAQLEAEKKKLQLENDLLLEKISQRYCVLES